MAMREMEVRSNPMERCTDWVRPMGDYLLNIMTPAVNHVTEIAGGTESDERIHGDLLSSSPTTVRMHRAGACSHAPSIRRSHFKIVKFRVISQHGSGSAGIRRRS